MTILLQIVEVQGLVDVVIPPKLWSERLVRCAEYFAGAGELFGELEGLAVLC